MFNNPFNVPVSRSFPAVQQVDPLSDETWDARLAGCSGASFFHGSSWARVLNQTYGFRPVYFAMGDATNVHSVLPVMEVDSWLTGKRGVSLPFTDECMPLTEDPEEFSVLCREVFNVARDRDWKYVEWRGGRRLLPDSVASATYFGHQLDLSVTEKALFSRFEGSNRQAVRKAERGGVTVEFRDDLAAVLAFHELQCKTRRRHGVLPQPVSFFLNIHRHVLSRKQGWVALASYDEQPIAGSIFFRFGGTALYKFGASDEAFQHLRANNLLMWEAIRRCQGDGAKLLDFGRTAVDAEGLRRFKLGWGSTEREIDYVRFDRRRNEYVRTRGESGALQSRVIRALPRPLFRMIGAALYRHAA